MSDDRDGTPRRDPDEAPDPRSQLDPDQTDALVDDVLAGRIDTDGAADPADPAGAPGIAAALSRVRAASHEPLPTASRDRHLLRIRTHEPAGRGRLPGGIRLPGRGWGLRRRLGGVVAGTLALVVATGGAAVAVAQDAQPDDALYGLKRTSEQVWLVVPRGSERAAQVHLSLAERRLAEARRAPAHAERLVAEGVGNVEAAAEERPEAAIDNFIRLLGDGEDRLPDQASPVARAALHRNCVRIAEKHDLGPERCGPEPDVAHPGRGLGQRGDQAPGRGLGQRDGEGPPGRGLGHRADDGQRPGHARGRSEVRGPRGWGPGGRPEGVVGPPPGTPGHERSQQEGAEQEGAEERPEE